VGATVFELERLRCHLRGKMFKAALPEEAGDEKYDETAAAVIALLKYGRSYEPRRTLRVPSPAQSFNP
jgi:transposase